MRRCDARSVGFGSDASAVLRHASLLHHTADRINDHVWPIELNVVRAVLRNDLRPARRKMRQFFLHLFPCFVGGLGQVGREMSADGLSGSCESTARGMSPSDPVAAVWAALSAKALQFRHAFARAVKIAFGGALHGVFITQTRCSRGIPNGALCIPGTRPRASSCLPCS